MVIALAWMHRNSFYLCMHIWPECDQSIHVYMKINIGLISHIETQIPVLDRRVQHSKLGLFFFSTHSHTHFCRHTNRCVFIRSVFYWCWCDGLSWLCVCVNVSVALCDFVPLTTVIHANLIVLRFVCWVKWKVCGFKDVQNGNTGGLKILFQIDYWIA